MKKNFNYFLFLFLLFPLISNGQGNVTEIEKENFSPQGNYTSPEKFLSGKVPGLQVSPNSGEPSTTFTTRIRGNSSLFSGNEPLIVIDGFPIDNFIFQPEGLSTSRNYLSFINPNEIEKISVLRDLGTVSVYGARASNGVILISTKKNNDYYFKKEKRYFVSYDGFVSFDNISKKIDVLNASDFKALITTQSPSKLSSLGTENNNWQDFVYRTAISNNHSIKIGYGSNKSFDQLGLNYQSNEGIIKGTQHTKMGLSFYHTNSVLNDLLTFSLDFKGSYLKDDYKESKIITNALTFDPTQNFIGTDANKYNGSFEFGKLPYDTSSLNPTALINQYVEVDEDLRALVNLNISLKIPTIEKLSVNTHIGFDLNKGQRNAFKPNYARGQETSLGFVKNHNYQQYSSNYEVFLKYSNKNEKDSKYIYDISLGYSYQDFRNIYSLIDGTNLSSNLFTIYSTSPATNLNSRVKSYTNDIHSAYLKTHQSYDNRYSLNANVRFDLNGGLRGKENSDISFGLGFDWDIQNETFFKNVNKDIINQLTLKANLGQVKNMVNRLDTTLNSETTFEYSFGTQIGVLKNKLNLGIYYFNRLSSDVIYYSNIAYNKFQNGGEINNSGVEFELNTTPIKNDDWLWNVGLNATYFTNNINKLPIDNTFVSGATQNLHNGYEIINGNKSGNPVNSFYLYSAKNNYSANEDKNGDGVIDFNDRVISKKISPDVIIGFSSYLKFKGFDLNIVCKSHIGNYIFNGYRAQLSNPNLIKNTSGIYNLLSEAKGINSNSYPAFSSDVYLEDASFFRFENILLAYNFEVKKINANFRVFLNVQNPILITSYKGYDPEVNGIDNNIYPRTTNFILGASINFSNKIK